MAMIEELSIRGIRSFGNELADEQKIQFSSPLTLIVGENGCGKTTIIESLKYALTGETPPGTDKGKTFIHDPKVYRTSSTLGQVKLKVKDVRGDSITCIRTMKTELLKSGKPKFETKDSVLRYETEDGQREESGRRVEEVNKEMCTAMGVSKAILNNVIFCHQEDSNWPLDESKKLKEKFDAIFGTTEYNKAIDKIIKIRKDYSAKLTACKQQKGFLEGMKKDADRKGLELDLLKEKHQTKITTLTALEASLIPIQAQLDALRVKEAQYGKMHGTKVVHELTISNCINNAESYRKKIKTLLDITPDEIEEQLKSSEKTKKTNSARLNLIINENKKKSDDENQLRRTIAEMNAKSETLIDKMGHLQDLVGKRVKSVQNLCKELGIAIPMDVDDDMSSESLKKILLKIQDGISEKERNLERMWKEAESKDLKAQEKIDTIREEKIASETNLVTQRQRVSKISANRSKVEREITSVESSMREFDRLVEDIATAQEDLDKVKSENNADDLEKELTVVETDRQQLECQVSVADADFEILESTLESISNVTKDINAKQQELTKNKSDFDRIKSKNSSTVKNLFGAKTIDGNYKKRLQSLEEELKSEVKTIKTSIEDAKNKAYRLQTQRDHLRANHKQKEAELTDINDKIYRMCDGRDYIDVLTSQREKVDKLNMELAFHKSSESSLKHYIKDIQQNPCCPLCHENLRNQGDDLKEEIDEKILLLPGQISETEKKLKAENAKWIELNEMKSSHGNVQKLKDELKKLDEDQKRVDKEYQETLATAEDFEMQVAEPDTKLKMMTQTFFTEMVRLDELAKSIEGNSRLLEDLTKKLPTEMPEKSLQEAKYELRQLKDKLKSKSVIVSDLSKKIHESRSNVNRKQETLNKMVSQNMANQEKIQGLDRMKTELIQIDQEKSELERTMKEDEYNLVPIKKLLESLIDNKLKEKEEASKNVKDGQNEIDNYRILNSDLERLNSEIASLEKENLQKANERAMEIVSECEAQIARLQEEMKETEQEIQRLNKEVVNHEGHQRNLQDNMELQKIEKEKKLAEDGLSKVMNDIRSMNPRKLQEEVKSLREERDNTNNQCQSVSGGMAELKNTIASAQKEVDEPRYRNAKINFMKECYKEAVLKALIDDLLKHRAALERALLKFHAEKMCQINKTIRELWNSIYKGNDIDYILIKTDEDDAPQAVSDKKRSYKYRVVQVKNGGAEIDMRGRCSAGQKVLASLIIRMALADTFSVHCGILALDEPTTNLDQSNISSLCGALTKLVEKYEKVGSFMLIIITHDQEFVTAMERSEHYFKLSRDARGRSRIQKVLNH